MSTNPGNATTHWLFDTEAGDTFADKCRDSLGGWANMMRRLEARFGGRVRVLTVADDGTAQLECNGTRVTASAWNKL